jgi:hypothetical protein
MAKISVKRVSFALLPLLLVLASALVPAAPVYADDCPTTVAKESISADVTIAAWTHKTIARQPKIIVVGSIRALEGGPSLPRKIKVALTAYYNPDGCDMAGFQEYTTKPSVSVSNGRVAIFVFLVPAAPNRTGTGAYMFRVLAYDAQTGAILGFHTVDPREGMPGWD